MSTNKSIHNTDPTGQNPVPDSPTTLTRRELLKALAIIPAAALSQAQPPTAPAEQPPAVPVVAGDPAEDEAACLRLVVIPALKRCIADFEARLTELAGGR